jgi:hypothetical protein
MVNMLTPRPKCESTFPFLSFQVIHKQDLILGRGLMFNIDREIV